MRRLFDICIKARIPPRARLLEAAKCGELRASTGLSNTLKSLYGIDNHSLRAERVDGGCRIAGTLPWVGHVADVHWRAVAAQLEDGFNQPLCVPMQWALPSILLRVKISGCLAKNPASEKNAAGYPAALVYLASCAV